MIESHMLILTKHEGSVFDLQKKKVAAGTLKKSMVFERKLDRASKKDMLASQYSNNKKIYVIYNFTK